MPKAKEEKAPKASQPDLADMVTAESEIEGAEDSPKEGNQPEIKEEKEPKPQEETSEPEKKDSQEKPEGQPPEPKADKSSEIASAISKANEKTQKELDMVAGLLRDSPEKLEELKDSDPKLYEKLIKRVPDLVSRKEENPEEKVTKLSSLLKTVLEKQEKRDFEEWRGEFDIEKADYDDRSNQFEDTARTLYEEGLVKDWKQAIRMAGEIVFPHIKEKPVDELRLKKLKGQEATAGASGPSEGGEFDTEDLKVMKREGVSEKEYKQAQKGEIFVPGIV